MEGWDTDRFVIAFMDISEFKALERELRSTLDVLGSVLHKAERGNLEAVVPLDHLPERYRPVGETINRLLQEARRSRLELLETLEVLTEALNHTLKGEPAVIMVQRLPERYRPVGETINRLVDETFLREAELKKIKEQLEETLQAQTETIKELSTPVIPVWGRVLMAPMLGSFDSVRMHELNETLLKAVATQKPLTVLLDLSGLAHVDTQVVGELVKLIIAVRILGTQTILVGIKPHLAQSLIHIGASLENIPTYATLEQGLRAAMARQA
jgi:anti-anti-sigma regulatory factor